MLQSKSSSLTYNANLRLYLEGNDVDPSKGTRDHDAPKGIQSRKNGLYCLDSILITSDDKHMM
jgi:hypothetical protein